MPIKTIACFVNLQIQQPTPGYFVEGLSIDHLNSYSSLETCKTFQKGMTTYLEFRFRDFLGNLIEPDNGSILFSISDIKGTSIPVAILKKSTGIYYSFYKQTTAGDFLLTFQGTINNWNVRYSQKLKVVD